MVLRIPIDTQSFMGSSLVIIIPNVMANHLSLQIESSEESFTFVDCSKRNSGGIVRNLEVQIDNALVPVDFYLPVIKLNWNSSLLLGRAFMATIGATPYNKIGDDPFLIAVCYSDAGAERESDSEASIDTQPEASFDNRFETTIDKNLDASVGSWAGEDHVESFVFLLQEGRFV
ncbi:hypothetical protein DY000_02015905 [Brassica cretica]|uniref:Uncharacterized protein n=1 Tax=Brassica cretica TaxID=69181 RepID=A0ABQ7CYB3_BRACR|nr:hypothetical protein DY000_02015905 [Brassica cretica]